MNFQDFPATIVQPPPVRTEKSAPVITYLSVVVLPEMLEQMKRVQKSAGWEYPVEGLEALSLDIQRRQSFGVEKYGELLATDNGRNPLVDAFQEVLDMIFFLGQAIMESIPGPRAEKLEDMLRSSILDAVNIREMIEHPEKDSYSGPSDMAVDIPVAEIKRIK